MRFTIDLLLAANPGYDADIFRTAISPIEDQLLYVRCKACGMVFTPYHWSDDILGTIYEEAINHQHSRQKITRLDKRLELTLEWANILRLLQLEGRDNLAHTKVVDYGCGWGDFLSVMQGPGIQLLGFDEDSVKAAFVQDQGLPFTDKQEDLMAFGPVDVVVMNSVLEHVLDVKNTLAFIHSILRPHGLLVVTVMDYRPRFLQTCSNRTSKSKPVTKNLNPIEHVNIFDYVRLDNTLRRHGFALEATNIPFLLFPRVTRPLLQISSRIERLLSHIIQHHELSITAYARKT